MPVFRTLLERLAPPPAVRKVLGGLVVTVVMSGAYFFNAVEPWELGAFDRMFRFRGPHAPATEIVIVNIDEDSFDEMGKLAATKTVPWPFPRAWHGTLLEIISSGEPRAIGVDIMFSTPSAFGPDDDKEFSESLARTKNVILGAAINYVSEGFYQKTIVDIPLPFLRERVAGWAPVNPTVDLDNVIRRMPLRQDVGGVMESMDLALYKLAAAGGVPVAPLPRVNEIIVNYRGPRQTFPWVPYHRVFKGDVNPAIFKDKIVLLGTSAALLHDIFSTPFERSGQMPGVEIHAHAIDTLVRGDRLREAPAVLSLVLALALAPLGAWLVLQLRAIRAFVAVAAISAVLAGLTYLAFSHLQIWFRPVTPTLALIFGYVATSIEHFVREQREKRRLSQFFSPDVLREIVRHPENVQLGSSRRLITVFFSDLRGFTSLSENMEPEVLAEMLREYLTEMTQVVFRHNGTVDKYIGDCVMAIWNAPFDDPNHAVNAVRTALDFQERTLQVSAKWEAKLGGKIRNGVGINTGDAVVGTMGSQQRLEYTAIGDTVNLAARLESITKEYNTAIIISESTYEYIKGQFMTRELGAVTVKGKTRPVKIYAVLPNDIRRHPRAALDSAATVTLEGLGQSYQVRTKDISESGIALVGVPHDLEKGTAIEIRCEGGGLPSPIVAHGLVMWKRGDAVGVAFTDIDKAVVPAVTTFVGSQEPSDAVVKN